MSPILHISDTHFGTVRPGVLQALLRFSDQQSPERVLFTGDITQRARRHQFDAARRFLERLGVPTTTVPGNHDIPLFNLPARIFRPFGNYRRVLGEDLEPGFESDSLLVIGVNTTRASRHTDGAVSPRQIARVARRLRDAEPGQLRIVIQHHPVRAVETSDLSNLLIGREEAVPTWVDAGMDVLLAGHIHLPYVRALQGSSQREAWTAQAGTALSSRTRGDISNSVNMLRYDAAINAASPTRCCVIERWDFTADTETFVLAESHHLEFAK